MKKERVLKYLILICTMIVSFFIFSNRDVSAIDFGINNEKIILKIEQVDESDVTKGYEIVGASSTCALGDLDCIDVEFPESYVDGHPIVKIKDSDNNLQGVLQNLSKVVSGKLNLGNGIQSIGKCAFCDFDYVEEYVLGENVSMIGEYAFAYNESLEIVEINAYDGNVRSVLANVNAFNSTTNLSKLVFKNSSIASTYKNDVSGWNSFALANTNVIFTYKVTYKFYNETVLSTFKPVIAYAGESLGEIIPEAPENKKGLNFKWMSVAYSTEVTSEVIARESQVDVVEGAIHEVAPNWSLKDAVLYIETTEPGDSAVKHELKQNSVEMAYGGKNKALSVAAIVEHELIGENGFNVEYSWSRSINGVDAGLVAIESIIDVAKVVDSGTYKCTITLSYEGYTSVVQNIEIAVTIRPKDLVVNINNLENEFGSYIESKEDLANEYFEIDSSTPFIDGESVKKFNFLGYMEKVNVGLYNNVLTGLVLEIGYEGDSDNYLSNYNIVYNAGDLEIVPKIINLSLNADIELEYGDNEILTNTAQTTIYEESETLIVEYIREDATNVNAGTYEVIDARIIRDNSVDGNYDVVLANSNPGKIKIKPKKVNVEWNIEENLVYSGIEKLVVAKYKNIANQELDLVVSAYKQDVPSILVNAGSYDLVAYMTEVNNNYELVGFEKQLTIEKANSVFIGAQRQIKVYNGLPQRVDVSLNHSEGIIQYGDYSSCKNAHLSTSSQCTITVSVAETENYKGLTGNFYLHIDSYELVVSPDLFEFNYGTVIGQNNLNGIYDGVNGETVKVYFAKDGNITNMNIGYYNIVSAYLSNNTNYKAVMVNGSGINKIKIIPAPVEIRFYFYEGLVYDGKVKNIGIRYFGTEEDVGLVVDYGNKTVIKNAGDYRIDVRLTNSNYYIEGTDYLEFSIAKATYDISNLKLESVKTTFNFKNHFISLQGDLPEGLIATYTIDGEHGNGTYLPFKHKIKVSFEGDYDNYNYVNPLVATLNISMDWVWWTLLTIVLVGVGVPVTFILLSKYKVIKFRKRIKRGVVRKLLKKSRELDSLYKEFKDKRDLAGVKEDDVEEGILAENIGATFVKNPVKITEDYKIEMSFVDELFKSSYGTKEYYSEVKNELLSYAGIVSKIKRDYETFYLNNIPVAKLDVVDGVLYAYFALDPMQYKVEEYKHENVSKKKEFASVPLKLKVDSLDDLRHAKMFVRIIRKREGIKSVSNFIRTDYVSVYTAKDNSLKLFKKAFVKKGTKEYRED